MHLHGPRYAVVDPAVAARRRAGLRERDSIRRVLVVMGDAADTGRVLAALDGITTRLHIDLVVGSAYPHHDALTAAAAASHHGVVVSKGVPDLAARMHDADLAVAAGGSECWALACLGVPMLLMPAGDHQRRVARGLVERGAAAMLAIGELPRQLADRDTLLSLGRAAALLVDTLGAARIAAVHQNAGLPLASSRLGLRPATAPDCRGVYDIVQDPVTRAMSHIRDPIPWEQHEAWYAARLADRRCLFLVHEHEGQVVGQVRFDKEAGEATISVSLHPAARGRGLATPLVNAGLGVLREQQPEAHVVYAHIKPDNTSSLRAFERAGFSMVGQVQVRGHAALELVRVV